jgi:hypothetical protein
VKRRPYSPIKYILKQGRSDGKEKEREEKQVKNQIRKE